MTLKNSKKELESLFKKSTTDILGEMEDFENRMYYGKSSVSSSYAPSRFSVHSKCGKFTKCILNVYSLKDVLSESNYNHYDNIFRVLLDNDLCLCSNPSVKFHKSFYIENKSYANKPFEFYIFSNSDSLESSVGFMSNNFIVTYNKTLNILEFKDYSGYRMKLTDKHCELININEIGKSNVFFYDNLSRVNKLIDENLNDINCNRVGKELILTFNGNVGYMLRTYHNITVYKVDYTSEGLAKLYKWLCDNKFVLGI